MPKHKTATEEKAVVKLLGYPLGNPYDTRMVKIPKNEVVLAETLRVQNAQNWEFVQLLPVGPAPDYKDPATDWLLFFRKQRGF